MLPFCGYNMADYFGHWLGMEKKMKNSPKIFHVNWFRTDENGKFLWPGYGENLRILEWILARCHDEAGAIQTPIGYIPKTEDIDMTGIKISKSAMSRLFEIDKEAWKEELAGHQEFFLKFGERLPAEIWQEYEALKGRLKI